MAFVYRSKRFLKEKETFDAGPGDYHLRKDLGASKDSSVPFDVSSMRTNIIDDKSTPGPGAYLKEKKFIHKNSFSINKTSPDSPTYNPFTNETKEHLFVSSSPRFQDANPDSKHVPGVGHYDLISNKKVERRVYLYEKNVPKYDTCKNDRVLSIPSKDKVFGYKEDKHGAFKSLDDPDRDLKYSGDKDNSIGPGRYDVEVKRRNVGVIDWSRSSSGNINHRYSNTENTNDNLNTSTTNKQSGLNNSKVFRTYSKDYGFNNDKSYIDLAYSTSIINDVNARDNNKKYHPVPGPGAYSPMRYGDMRKFSPKLKQFQHFGSTSDRDLTLHNNIKTNSTSDNYYLLKELNEKYKRITNIPIKPLKKIIYTNPDETSKKSILQKETVKSKVGPGTYNPKPDDHHSSSSIEHFHVLEKRFAPINKDNTPGAGAYLNLNTWVSERPLMNSKLRTSSDMIVNYNKCASSNKDSNDNAIPGVGQYNPAMSSTIEYKIQRSKHNRKFAPFCVSDKRLVSDKVKKRINIENGPGRYNLRKELVCSDPKQIKHPFMVSSKRSFTLNNDHVGPGEYNRFSHFDWNKKTFNALFI